MLKSEMFRGQIYAGATLLGCNLGFEQTGPLQITISPGSFVDTSGYLYELDEAQLLDVDPDPDIDQYFSAQLISDRAQADVALMSRFEGGLDSGLPGGWQQVQPLILEFKLPAGTTNLDSIETYYLSVLPGFPEGTTAGDWQIQTGGAGA